MDHMRILRRALEITRNYRVLWIFGILVALTTGRGSSGNPGGGNGGGNNSGNGTMPTIPNFPNFPDPGIPAGMINTIIAVGIGVLCLLVLLGVLFTILRYVSMTALIRMTDQYETSGEKLGFRQGWRLGWSRAALRTWLIDLLFGLGAFVIALVLVLIAIAPLLVWFTNQESLHVIGTIAAIGLGLLVIFVLVVFGALLGVLSEFFRRAVILEDLGVRAAIRRGWELARRKVGDVLIMALILFGITLGLGLLMLPVVIALLLLGAMAGGLPALLAGFLTNLFVQGNVPLIVAIIIGLPIFLLILILPTSFINGVIEVFTSGTWTLTYREIRALQTVQPEPLPAAE